MKKHTYLTFFTFFFISPLFSFFKGKSEKELIEMYTENITQKAKNGMLKDVIGREDEIEQLGQILGRLTKPNALLIGKPGVGKTAIVEGLALKIVRQEVSDPDLVNLTIIELKLSLLDNSSMMNESQKRLSELIDIFSKKKNVVLFVDEVHGLIRKGLYGSNDLANLLKPALARGDIRMIGATTLDEYQAYIRQDMAFDRRFGKIEVEEPSPDVTKKILRESRHMYESEFGVEVSEEAIEAAVVLSTEFIKDNNLPDRAIEILEGACTKVSKKNRMTPPQIVKLSKEMDRLHVKKEGLLLDQSADREEIKRVEEEIEKKSVLLQDLNEQYHQERKKLQQIKKARILLQSYKKESRELLMRKKYRQVAILEHVKIPELIEKIKKSKAGLLQIQGDNPLIPYIVTQQEVKEVIATYLSKKERALLKKEVLKKGEEKRKVGLFFKFPW